MHILILGINYWPEQTGIAVFNTGRCEYLASRGYKVTICTAFPYYPEWRIMKQYRERLFYRENRNGVSILRSYLYVPKKVTTISRVIHEASFIITSAINALRGHRPDLIFTVSPPLGLGISTIGLSKYWKIPFIFHVPDLQPDAALDLGMLPRGPMARFLYTVERKTYHYAALVSTLSQSMRKKIISKGIPSEKVVVLPDWVDPVHFEIPIDDGGEAFRRIHGLEKKRLVIHMGNMGIKQGLEVILKAAEMSLCYSEITYLLIGDGVARNALETQAKYLDLTNVRFLPLLPPNLFFDMLAAADICLITQRRSVADIVFPSKVLTLLSSGRPIVASLNHTSEVAKVITEAKAGIVVDPEDPDHLLRAILSLLKNPEQRSVYGRNGRSYAMTHWNREKILSAMEAHILQIAHNDGTQSAFDK